MGNLYESSFKSFLHEKKRNKKSKKKRTKSKRKYAVGGGPAVGQGGMGGELGGDGGGESVKRSGSLLAELAMQPNSFSANVLSHTQQSTSNKKASPVFRMSYQTGYEEQESENEIDSQEDDTEEDSDHLDSEFDELDDQEDDVDDQEEPTDPDREGIIRTVDDAHLVYKRQTSDGDYEELWIYNTETDLKDELQIRRNILAGTDIPEGKTRSEDGSQTYDLATLGNAQLLHITGLPN